jgi:hydroxymethylbilane synthase
MMTSGDLGATTSTDAEGSKGLFVAEIVRALREARVDLAVHSAKDLPVGDEDDLVIAAVPERASPLDVLVTRSGELIPGARVGTSSLRRRAQLARWRPDILPVDLRGNVDTRLRRLDEGVVDALVLAGAGLVRLGVVPDHASPLSVAEMVPAPGQGCLAVQVRAADATTIEAVAQIDHGASRAALEAERGLVARLEGGCALPLGALAEPTRSGVKMTAIVLQPDGGRFVRAEIEAASPADAAELTALDLLARGADEILARLRP